MKKWVVTTLVVVLIGAGVLFFKSGGIVYYETLRMGNQSSGYLGKKSIILENQEQLEQIFLDLEEAFENQPFNVLSFSINNRRINLIIQDVNQPTYFDNYIYDGTSFFAKWEKGRPYKTDLGTELVSFNQLSAEGFSYFYQQITDYLAEGNYEVDEDRMIQLTVSIPTMNTEPYLQSSVSGLREDFSFKADLSGNNFERVN